MKIKSVVPASIVWFDRYIISYLINVTWLPKACRTADVRKDIAEAVMKVMVANPTVEIGDQSQ